MQKVCRRYAVHNSYSQYLLGTPATKPKAKFLSFFVSFRSIKKNKNSSRENVWHSELLKTELYFRKRNLREDGDVCQNHQKLDFRRCVYENAPLLPVFRAHRVRVFSDALHECVRMQRRDFTQRERMLHGERTGKMPVVHRRKGRVSQRRCHDVLLLWHRRRRGDHRCPMRHARRLRCSSGSDW